jgi:hypothetical protein
MYFSISMSPTAGANTGLYSQSSYARLRLVVHPGRSTLLRNERGKNTGENRMLECQDTSAPHNGGGLPRPSSWHSGVLRRGNDSNSYRYED